MRLTARGRAALFGARELSGGLHPEQLFRATTTIAPGPWPRPSTAPPPAPEAGPPPGGPSAEQASEVVVEVVPEADEGDARR